MRLRNVLPMLFAGIFLLTTNVMADEVVLCTSSSDIDSDIGKIVVAMDQDNRVVEHLYQDNYHEGKLTSRLELSPLELKEGIVLNRKDKYIIVRMHSDNYDPERGGVLYLDTLYSGVSGQRKEYEMDFALDKSGPVLIQNKEIFSKMKFIAKRSKILGVIGIERIEFGK